MSNCRVKKSIVVLGAGPAGLSFALCAAKLLPSYALKVFEAGDKDTISGIGYTVQSPTLIVLSSIVKNFMNFREEICCTMWDRIEVGIAPNTFNTFPMSKSFGCPRHVLIRALQDRVQDTGIEVEYNCSLDEEAISQLVDDCDLVVGADGKGSIVRQAFSGDLRASWTQPASAAGWAVSSLPTTQMAVRFFPTKRRFAITTEYQINSLETCVILDTEQDVWRPDRISILLDECPELSKHLAHRSMDLHQFHLTQSKTHVCDPPFFRNIVLIGDAAISTHYSLGAGLLVAFYSARELARCLKEASITPEAMRMYRQYVMENLVPLHVLADQRSQWFDNVREQNKGNSQSDLIARYVEMCRRPPSSVEYQLRVFADEVLSKRRN